MEQCINVTHVKQYNTRSSSASCNTTAILHVLHQCYTSMNPCSHGKTILIVKEMSALIKAHCLFILMNEENSLPNNSVNKCR